jgi:phosphoglycolate phosphatase
MGVLENRVYDGIPELLSGALSNKTDLIRHILERENLDRTRMIMVGDRSYDILGAKQCGIASIGVTYGFGTREGLAASGADWIADQPLELMKAITMINTGPKKSVDEPVSGRYGKRAW